MASLDLALLGLFLAAAALRHVAQFLGAWVEGWSRSGLETPRVVAGPLRLIDAVATSLGRPSRAAARGMRWVGRPLDRSGAAITRRHRSLLARLP